MPQSLANEIIEVSAVEMMSRISEENAFPAETVERRQPEVKRRRMVQRTEIDHKDIETRDGSRWVKIKINGWRQGSIMPENVGLDRSLLTGLRETQGTNDAGEEFFDTGAYDSEDQLRGTWWTGVVRFELRTPAVPVEQRDEEMPQLQETKGTPSPGAGAASSSSRCANGCACS